MNDNNMTENDGISFSDIHHFFKKYFAMILVGVILCCILAVIIGSIMNKTAKPDSTAIATYNLTYDGAENGKNPDGHTNYNKNSIKNPELVIKALNKANLNEKYKVEQIISAIKVDEIVPKNIKELISNLKEEKKYEELAKLNFIPTSYAVSLDINKVENMTEQDAKAIVNNLIDEYNQNFSEKFIEKITFASENICNSEDDYSAQIFSMQAFLDKITPYIKNLNKKDSQFSSSNGNFASHLQDLIWLQKKLNDIDANIQNQGLTKNKDFLLNIYNAELDKITEYIEAKKANIERKNEIFNMYKDPEYKVENDKIVVVDRSQAKEKIALEISQISSEIETLEANKSMYEKKIKRFTENPIEEGANENIENSLEKLNQNVKTKTEHINETLQEYYASKINNSITNSKAVIRSNTKTINWKYTMLIAVAVGIIAGFPLTHIFARLKIYKKNKKVKA